MWKVQLSVETESRVYYLSTKRGFLEIFFLDEKMSGYGCSPEII